MFELACTGLLGRVDEEIAVVLFVMGGIVAISAIAGHFWVRNREVAYNARLKQLMIERGMTADEIVRVVQAGPSHGSGGEEFTKMFGGRCRDGAKL